MEENQNSNNDTVSEKSAYDRLNDYSSGVLLSLFLLIIFFTFVGFGITTKTPIALIILYSIVSVILVSSLLAVIVVVLTNRPTETNSINEFESAYIELNKNYNVLRKQTMIGFYIAITTLIAGTGVMLYAIIMSVINQTTINNLAIISGVIIEFISGTSFIVFKTNFTKLNITSDELFKMWKIVTAFKKADELNDNVRDETKIRLIENLTK